MSSRFLFCVKVRLVDPRLRGLLFYKYCMQETAHMKTMPSATGNLLPSPAGKF